MKTQKVHTQAHAKCAKKIKKIKNKKKKRNPRQNFFGERSTLQKLYKKIGCTDLNETRVTNSMDNEGTISRITSASVELGWLLARRRTIVVIDRARAGSKEWAGRLIPKSLH